jgi:hypothetical protein
MLAAKQQLGKRTIRSSPASESFIIPLGNPHLDRVSVRPIGSRDAADQIAVGVQASLPAPGLLLPEDAPRVVVPADPTCRLFGHAAGRRGPRPAKSSRRKLASGSSRWVGRHVRARRTADPTARSGMNFRAASD